MQLLNSVFIEGEVTGEVKKLVDVIDFTVRSERKFKFSTSVLHIRCVYYGVNIDKAKRFINDGQGVRVVGILKDGGQPGEVVLVVEHIEYKLNKTKK